MQRGNTPIYNQFSENVLLVCSDEVLEGMLIILGSLIYLSRREAKYSAT